MDADYDGPNPNHATPTTDETHTYLVVRSSEGTSYFYDAEDYHHKWINDRVVRILTISKTRTDVERFHADFYEPSYVGYVEHPKRK